MAQATAADPRWQLYRLLSDPFRLRLLALAAEEELSVGELSELMAEPQPNVSRHAAPLRQAGLLADRRQGSRTLVRLADGAATDPVVADALGTGRRLCREDGSLGRVADVVRSRDARTREFFSRPGKPADPPGIAPELPAYLAALAPLIGDRRLALDAGTGDGTLLDVLSPLFDRVIALDRSEAQLGRALRRVQARGYSNVELVCDELGGETLRGAVGDGASIVLAARMLHHSPLPRATMRQLVELVRPGGWLFVFDYARHDDETFREQQADVWMGFEQEELLQFAIGAGLDAPRVAAVPSTLVSRAGDGHLRWLLLSGRRAQDGAAVARAASSNGAKRSSGVG